MKTENIIISTRAFNTALVSEATKQSIAGSLSRSLLPSFSQRIRLGKLQTQAQKLLKDNGFSCMGSTLQPTIRNFGKLMRCKALCYRQFGGRYLQLKARRAQCLTASGGWDSRISYAIT